VIYIYAGIAFLGFREQFKHDGEHFGERLVFLFISVFRCFFCFLFFAFSLLLYLLKSTCTHFNRVFSTEGEPLCHSLWRCTIVAISGGLRAGDVGKMMLDNEWSDGGLILFKFSYFVIVILLLLNVILGIVLDTFAELRQDALEAEDSIYNFCFVCSIDRQTFDRFGQGFDDHFKNDHFLWNVSRFTFSSDKKRSRNPPPPTLILKAFVHSSLTHFSCVCELGGGFFFCSMCTISSACNTPRNQLTILDRSHM
jgi:hypothetical protein